MGPLPFRLGHYQNARSTFISASRDAFGVQHISYFVLQSAFVVTDQKQDRTLSCLGVQKLYTLSVS